MSVTETDLGQPTTTPSAEPTPVTPPPDWRASLPEELRSHPSLQSFKDVAGLAKGWIDTKAMVGQRQEGLKVPSATSTPEEIKAFHKALGVPDTPGQYQIKRPQAALDLNWDDKAESGFLAAMHAKGAPPAVVQGALEFYANHEAAKLSEARAEARNAEVSLRNEWGANYDAKLGRANRALQALGGDALVARLDSSGFGRDAAMVKAFAAVGDMMMQHGLISGDTLQGVTPEAAKQQITELRQQLTTKPEGSTEATEIINRIIALSRAARG